MGRLTKIKIPILCLLGVCACVCSWAQETPEDKIRILSGIIRPSVGDWRYKPGDVENGQDPSLDDSSWQTGSPEFTWGNQPAAWLRTTITIPEDVVGVPIHGGSVTLQCAVDDDGVVYVNGKKVQEFHWSDGRVLLTDNARPGEQFHIAIQGRNRVGPGRLLAATVEYGALGKLAGSADEYLRRYYYARDLCGVADDADRKRFAQALADSMAAVDVKALRSGDNDAFLASLRSAGSKLEPIDELTKDLNIYMVGHAHIDMNWLWLWPETIEVCKNTFSTASRLMNDFPYVLSQSQPAVYLAMQEHEPEVFEKIKSAIERGQWEVTGTTWTEGDNNMSSGEAIVRSILYGKRYMMREFGVDSPVSWFPDNFGHPWTLPQILSKSGIKYYYFMRCGNGHPVFWWQGPDGSRVLAYNYGSYNNGVDSKVGMKALQFAAKTGLSDFMHVYGVGDHGGGPTIEMLKTARELQSQPRYPKIRFAKTADYFQTIAESGVDFPVWNSELNTVFEGCYTSHADIKSWNRRSENLLACAEKFSTIAANWSMDYPAKDFERSWRSTCFNQFHDLLCGTAIHGSYDYSRSLYRQAAEQGYSALVEALRALTAIVDTRGPGIPIVVFNPLSWTRTDAVEAPSPLPGESTEVVLSDSTGAEYAGRNIGDKLYFTARNVPPLGYKVFWLNRASGPVRSSISATDSTVENEFFRVVIDRKRGVISSIYDKVNSRQVLPKDGLAGLLQILLEKPRGMSAWTIGEIADQENLLDDTEVVLLDKGPAKGMLTFDHLYDRSTIVQNVTVYDGVPRIDIRITADWQEIGGADKSSPMLKCAFATALKNPRATFEIPFGFIERAANGAEVPALRWIDLSERGYGVSLINDCKYGFDANGSVMRATLLRSSYRPDPTPDQGMHDMILSIYPHKGDWRKARTVRRGWELNQPLIARIAEEHPGMLPAARSFVSVTAPNIVVTALKQAEDDSSLILRFYETDGRDCRTTISFNLPVRYYVETDLLERPVGAKQRVMGGEFSVKVGKHEIKTYKLLLK